MSDDPTPLGDGEPVEPTDEAPDPIGIGDHVTLLTEHHGDHLTVARREMLLVHSVDEDAQTADCRITRRITVPLTELRRWQ